MRWEKPPVLEGEQLLAEPIYGSKYDVVHSLDIEALNNSNHTVSYRVEEIRNIFRKPFQYKLEIKAPPKRFVILRQDGVMEDFCY